MSIFLEIGKNHTSVPTFLSGIGYDMGIYPILIHKYSIFWGILDLSIKYPISYPIPNKKVGTDVW